MREKNKADINTVVITLIFCSLFLQIGVIFLPYLSLLSLGGEKQKEIGNNSVFVEISKPYILSGSRIF